MFYNSYNKKVDNPSKPSKPSKPAEQVQTGYFKNSAANFALIASAAALLVLTLDWLFFYYMPGYSGAASRWLWFVLPTAALSVPVCFPLFGVVRRIHEEFKIDNGVV